MTRPRRRPWRRISASWVAVAAAVLGGAGACSGDDSAGDDVGLRTESVEGELGDVGLRAGFSDGARLWFAGGLQRQGDGIVGVNTLAELDPGLNELSSTDLPVPDGQFLTASWVGEDGDDVLVLGTLCPILPNDPGGCLHSDPSASAVLYRVVPDGSVVELRLPDVVLPAGDGGRAVRAFKVFGFDGERFVVGLDPEYPGRKFALLEISADDGAVTPVEHPFETMQPPDALSTGLAPVCATRDTIYAFGVDLDAEAFAAGAGVAAFRSIAARSYSLDPGAEERGWVDEFVLGLDDSLPLGNPLPNCLDRDVLLGAIATPATTLVPVIRDGAVASPIVVDPGVRPTGTSQHLEDRSIVTAFAATPNADGTSDLIVYDYSTSGGWVELARRSGPGETVKVVQVDGVLIDLSPGWVLDDVGGSGVLARPF